MALRSFLTMVRIRWGEITVESTNGGTDMLLIDGWAAAP